MVGQKAISIAFSLANPKMAAIDIEQCIKCKKCVKVCAPNAIDFDMQPQNLRVEAKSVVIATGFNLFDAKHKPQYGFGQYPNVINAMQMDRLLSLIHI